MPLATSLGLLLCPACRRDWPGASGCCQSCRFELFRPICLPESTALGLYRGKLRSAIRAYKFQGARRLASLFAGALAAAVNDRQLQPAIERVTHVPLHRHRARSRGYDQARLLAKGVALRLRLPYVDALIRTRDTPQQARLRAKERRANVHGAFTARGRQPAVLLLIDDVLTTGATLAECRSALRAAGAGTVYFGVIAIAPAARPESVLRS